MLSDDETAVLDFAALRFKYAGARDAAIRERFDVSPTRYSQQLAALLDRADALAANPALVNRLRRLREARRAVRTG